MFNIPLAIKWASIAAISLAVLFGLWYISNLKANLATSEQNSITLADSISTQQDVIDNLKYDLNHIKRINKSVIEQSNELQKEVRTLQKKFKTTSNGAKRDLGVLARAKPKLIQNIINKATDNVNRCFELVTGSKLKAGEKRSCE